MVGQVNVQELERALVARARTLAEEYKERAERSRQRIIEEENDRLRLREERETLAAKAMADRTYRRRVQQAELALHKELDQQRWALIREVLGELPARLAKLAADETAYLPVLAQLLARSAAAIERDDLVCELNAADLKRLKPRWKEFTAAAAAGRSIALHPEPLACSGGLLLRSADDRIRVDNTFEGRLERLEEPLEQAIVERLFATATPGQGAF